MFLLIYIITGRQIFSVRILCKIKPFVFQHSAESSFHCIPGLILICHSNTCSLMILPALLSFPISVPPSCLSQMRFLQLFYGLKLLLLVSLDCSYIESTTLTDYIKKMFLNNFQDCYSSSVQQRKYKQNLKSKMENAKSHTYSEFKV